MFMTKVRIMLAGVLAVGVVSTGAAVFGRQLVKDAKPDQAQEKVNRKDDPTQPRVENLEVHVPDPDRDLRFDKLGLEADQLSAEIEVLQIETDEIKQRLQQSIPRRNDGFGFGGGMMGGMGGGMGGGFARMPKPKNEKEKKEQEEARAEQERAQEEFRSQQREAARRAEDHYEMLKRDFLEKSIKLGGMRRRLETINGQLAFRPNQPMQPMVAEVSKAAAVAPAAEMDLKHRLNVIERKLDEIKQKFDQSGLDSFQQKMNQMLNKFEGLKR